MNRIPDLQRLAKSSVPVAIATKSADADMVADHEQQYQNSLLRHRRVEPEPQSAWVRGAGKRYLAYLASRALLES